MHFHGIVSSEKHLTVCVSVLLLFGKKICFDCIRLYFALFDLPLNQTMSQTAKSFVCTSFECTMQRTKSISCAFWDSSNYCKWHAQVTMSQETFKQHPVFGCTYRYFKWCYCWSVCIWWNQSGNFTESTLDWRWLINKMQFIALAAL